MEGKLDLIITQNWILLGLLVIVVICNFICNFYFNRQQKSKRDDPDFSNLWETDQIDTLLEKSEEFIKKYPNRIDAFYFRAKALKKLGKNDEAKKCYERVAQIDPSFKENVMKNIESIDEQTAANKSLKSGTPRSGAP